MPVHFCEWGSSALTKVRPFPEERVYAEIEWLGKNKCPYADCCDANTGILKVRDKAIVQKLVETKAQYGYPQTFRTSFAKNSNEVVWDIANVLHKAGMLKAVTLAMQSMDKDVLKVIKRKNIPFDNFIDLVKRYDDAGIPTYTELIMGLPGETLETYLNGIEQCLEAGQHAGLFCYLNCMLPNTEQAKPAYRNLHGLRTVDMQAMLSHGTPDSSEIRERQETIIETKAMPHSDWRRAYLFSKVVEVFHVQGLLQKTAIVCHDKWGMKYRDFYFRLMWWLETYPTTIAGQEYKGIQTVLDRALSGGSWDCVDPLLGDISWPPEEFAFAHICCQLERFYDEIWDFYTHLLENIEIVVLWADQRQELVGPEPGKEMEWARTVIWYGRKGLGKKLKVRRSD